MNKRLHILLVTAWYPSEKEPTAASFVKEQALLLKDKGHTVTVVHSYLKGTFRSTLLNRRTEISDWVEDGIRTIRIGVSPFFPGMRSKSYRKLCKVSENYLKKTLIGQAKVDLIHSHSLFMGGIVGMHLSSILNIPQIHTEHTSGLVFSPEQYTSNDITWLKKCYVHCKKVIVVSHWFREKLIEKYQLDSEKLTLIANPVDDRFFQTQISYKEEVKKALIIGNFIPVKQHDLLLNAWSIVLKKYPNLLLTIAGDGPMKTQLQDLEEKLGISATLEWLPRQDRHGVLKLIQDHDLVISSSKVETFGLTIAEATACGKPVVVTDSGGVRDIVNEVNGIITPQSAEEFANGIFNVIENYTTYKADFIRQDSSNRFSSEIIGKQFDDLYRKVLNPESV
ncbi:MAG: glycosyltransferase family 4 protein [Bacteroidetes bacterium]|nr:MAG: glycosyltransferase family 4 protein [Bacteroidota bacterium]